VQQVLHLEKGDDHLTVLIVLHSFLEQALGEELRGSFLAILDPEAEMMDSRVPLGIEAIPHFFHEFVMRGPFVRECDPNVDRHVAMAWDLFSEPRHVNANRLEEVDTQRQLVLGNCRLDVGDQDTNVKEWEYGGYEIGRSVW
jgi:hypothetical protein